MEWNFNFQRHGNGSAQPTMIRFQAKRNKTDRHVVLNFRRAVERYDILRCSCHKHPKQMESVIQRISFSISACVHKWDHSISLHQAQLECKNDGMPKKGCAGTITNSDVLAWIAINSSPNVSSLADRLRWIAGISLTFGQLCYAEKPWFGFKTEKATSWIHFAFYRELKKAFPDSDYHKMASCLPIGHIADLKEFMEVV